MIHLEYMQNVVAELFFHFPFFFVFVFFFWQTINVHSRHMSILHLVGNKKNIKLNNVNKDVDINCLPLVGCTENVKIN